MVNTYQWQAQPVAQPPEAAAATGVDEASALLAAEPASVDGAGLLSEGVAAGAVLPPLKSVAYQPEPLS